MATITSDGFVKVEEDEVAERFRALLERLSTPESTATTGAAPQMPNVTGGGGR
jgi:hypothetical protein